MSAEATGFHFYRGSCQLWLQDFPENERKNVIAVRLGDSNIWVTREPLRAETVRSLGLEEVSWEKLPEEIQRDLLLRD